MAAATRAGVSRLLKLNIAVMTGRDSDALSGGEAMGSLDMDSVDSIELAMRVERELGREIDPEIFLRSSSTIDHIVDQLIDAPET